MQVGEALHYWVLGMRPRRAVGYCLRGVAAGAPYNSTTLLYDKHNKVAASPIRSHKVPNRVVMVNAAIPAQPLQAWGPGQTSRPSRRQGESPLKGTVTLARPARGGK